MSQIIVVQDADFDSVVLQSETPVLVDFWAEWCGPCKAIAPTLAELAEDFSGKVTIAKLNVDDNSEIPVKYAIRSIPTLHLFKNGEIVDSLNGALPKAQLTDFINKHL